MSVFFILVGFILEKEMVSNPSLPSFTLVVVPFTCVAKASMQRDKQVNRLKDKEANRQTDKLTIEKLQTKLQSDKLQIRQTD